VVANKLISHFIYKHTAAELRAFLFYPLVAVLQLLCCWPNNKSSHNSGSAITQNVPSSQIFDVLCTKSKLVLKPKTETESHPLAAARFGFESISVETTEFC